MKNSSRAVPVFERPLASLAALVAVVAVISALVAGCGGGQKTAEMETTPPAATPAAGDAAPVGGEVDGASLYAQRCALCHGAGGMGDGPGAAGLSPKPRDHTDGAYMRTLSDEQVVQVIRDGKGQMPAWGSVLTEDEIQALLRHVRSLAR